MTEEWKTICYSQIADDCELYVPPFQVTFLKKQGHQRFACIKCRDILAKQRKHTIVPMHKSNYMLVTNQDDLIGINNKGGLVK